MAKSLVSYSKRHPELELTRFVIPQVPGSISRSDSVDGVIESVLKTKKVSLPSGRVAPGDCRWSGGGLPYEGRFNPKRDAAVLDIGEVIQEQTPDKAPGRCCLVPIPMVYRGSSDARIPAVPAAQAGPGINSAD